MYKRFSVQQLTQIQTKFFDHIQAAMSKDRIPLFKQFLRRCHRIGHSTTYFKSGSPFFRVVKQGGSYILIDEVEKLEVHCTDEDLTKLHSLLKNTKKIKRMNKQNKSVMMMLQEKFDNGEHRTINDKPYLVYDIETTYATQDLSQCKWIIGYMIDTSKANPKYQYIGPEDYGRFYEYLRDYDGYIIGWNNIGFDNPVTAYNAGMGADEIQALNDKSIDPFLFLWHLTKKKIGLNRASQALVGVTKTLESGAEAEVLYNQYLNDGDEKAMKDLKKYCRNDVKMTLLTRLYLLDHETIYRDGDELSYTLEDIVRTGNIPLGSSAQSETEHDAPSESQGGFFG